jgi:hypothetical protein
MALAVSPLLLLALLLVVVLLVVCVTCMLLRQAWGSVCRWCSSGLLVM